MIAWPPAYVLIPLPGEGPEDVVAGPDGVIYTGLKDGRVLAIAQDDGSVREVAGTGGRPLGLEATADGRLLICDSPNGLLELDLRTGALKTLVTHDGAERLIFCSNVVAAPDGEIFFTVSSMRYAVSDWKKDIVENVPTGRVYRRAANGALTSSRTVCASPTASRSPATEKPDRRRDCRTWSHSSGAGGRTGGRKRGDRGASRLSRQPRRRRRRPRLGRPRLGANPALERLHKLPLPLRRPAARLPEFMQPKPSRIAWVAAYDEQGQRVRDFKWRDGGYAMVTGVCRAGNR